MLSPAKTVSHAQMIQRLRDQRCLPEASAVTSAARVLQGRRDGADLGERPHEIALDRRA